MSLHSIQPEKSLDEYMWVSRGIPCPRCGRYMGAHHDCAFEYFLQRELNVYAGSIYYCVCATCRINSTGAGDRTYHYFITKDSMICDACTNNNHPFPPRLA